MRRHSRLHRFSAWLACLAMVFAVLAPTISHARADGGWTEVCSVGGVKLVKLAGDASLPEGDMAAHGEHCPFCFLHVDAAGPVPALAALVHPADVVQIYPPLFFQAPRHLFIWAPAQSRAPPASI